MSRASRLHLLATSLAILFPLLEGSAQQTANGRLQVVVEPEAKMTIEAIGTPVGETSGRWLRVGLTIRMNPERTATLSAEAAKGTGGEVTFLVKGNGDTSPRAIKQGEPLFTTTENGRHSLLVVIVAENQETSTRFVLRSSDDAIHVAKVAAP